MMMGYTARTQPILLVILSTIVLLFLLITSGCIGDPATDYLVDNRTDQILEIFIDNLPHCDAPPREISRHTTIVIYPDPIISSPDEKYAIEARTKDGEVVYSQEFTWQELDDMDWTIVIPPPPE